MEQKTLCQTWKKLHIKLAREALEKAVYWRKIKEEGTDITMHEIGYDHARIMTAVFLNQAMRHTRSAFRIPTAYKNK
jgi:hypothetical protein